MNLPKKEKFITEKEALTKIYGFCSYQERSQQEVREKLKGFGLNDDKIDELIAQLIGENFLNEERFAKQYAGGKFRIKHWGKRKIEASLKQKEISSNLINIALKEIPDEAYVKTLTQLIVKRNEMETGEDLFQRKGKIAQHIIGKGYEPELVWEILDKKIT